MGIVGRPTKARDKLRNNFMAALADDFTAHGAQAIVNAREKDPLGYVKVCASLMPKEVELSRPLDDFTDEQLAAALDTVRAIEAAQNSGSGAETTVVLQPAQKLQPVPETS
jgi:hypothetical protein